MHTIWALCPCIGLYYSEENQFPPITDVCRTKIEIPDGLTTARDGAYDKLKSL